MTDEGKPTQPTLETLLERMNTLGDQIASVRSDLGDQITSLRSAMDSQFASVHSYIETQIASVRSDMNHGFTSLRDEIAVVGDDTRNSRATQRSLLRRIEELESKTP